MLRLLSAILIALFFCHPVWASTPNPPDGKIIVVDPGHGGKYHGAVQNGVREADVNLTVSLKLREILTNLGFKVVLTRTFDTTVASPEVTLASDLQARIDMAIQYNADIFISLHANSDPENSDNTGIICFYGTGRPDRLASAIQHSVIRETKALDGGVRPANFYVLRNSEVPAVLVEMGFLTNQSDALLLTDAAYQYTVASGISKGIVQYFTEKDLDDHS